MTGYKRFYEGDLAGDLSLMARTVPWVLQGRGWSWNKGAKEIDPAPARAERPTPSTERQAAIFPPSPPGTAARRVAPASRDDVPADAA